MKLFPLHHVVSAHLFLLLGLGSILVIIGCSSTASPDTVVKIETAMDSIRQVYVPDRRVEILDYEIRPNRIVGRTSHEEAFEQIKSLQKRFDGLDLDSFQFLQPMDIALVNVSVGNIRSNPRHSAELSTQVLLGQQLTVWDKNNYWYYIQTPDDYLGWIDGGGIFLPEENELGAYRTVDKVMYQAEFGFCYENPDTDGPILSDLVAGNILLSMGPSEGGFIRVGLPDGRTGFVPSSQVVRLEEVAKAGVPDWNDIRTTAYRFMGRPYLWGGTSGKGVDCSGFTKMVYYLNGLELPRDASQQIRSGIEVPLDDNLTALQPGDFLFFGYRPDGSDRDRITHVGIHLGDGRMIHSSQRVQIESLMPDDPDFAPDRRKTLLAAKRMVVNGDLAEGVNPIRNDPAYGF